MARFSTKQSGQRIDKLYLMGLMQQLQQSLSKFFKNHRNIHTFFATI